MCNGTCQDCLHWYFREASSGGGDWGTCRKANTFAEDSQAFATMGAHLRTKRTHTCGMWQTFLLPEDRLLAVLEELNAVLYPPNAVASRRWMCQVRVCNTYFGATAQEAVSAAYVAHGNY